MNFLLCFLATILALILPLVRTYTATVVLESLIINSQTAYTFKFVSFPNNTARTIVLTFPSSSDISSGTLAIFVNNNPTALSGSYTVDTTLRKITISNQVPVSN